uniref:AP complex subunit beta n=1 Tax=Blastobotrys adeninivorans TaxID=409370 RepID=A0A060TBD8_BLAAD
MADSLTKISAMLESARELTLEAASSASSRFLDESSLRPKDISALLNGRTDREKRSGMNHVMSLMAKGTDVSEYFADVVKNTASTSLEVRKLVYIYLIQYADHEPDLALLSINTIQKSLGDQSPLVRSMAIKVMSGIRVPSIAPIVALAIKQCSSDLTAIVRRSAALAIGKCYELDPSTGPGLLVHLEKLLKDQDPLVQGPALMTLANWFPDKLEMLHSVYRSICRNIRYFDEWCQVATLDLLINYVRRFVKGPPTSRDDTDPDLLRLLDAVAPLLYSRNGSVIIQAAKVYFYLGYNSAIQEYSVAPFVVRLLRSDSAVQQVALVNIRSMAMRDPAPFEPFVSHFYLFPSDTLTVKQLKLHVLTLLCNQANSKQILSELKYYALHMDLAEDAMGAIARCTTSGAVSSQKIIRWLMKQIVRAHSEAVVSEALSIIRILVQRDFSNQIHTVVTLSHALMRPIAPSAKASIIWLVGELVPLAPETAIEVLRLNTKNFAAQHEQVRYQLVLLASKVYAYHLDKKTSDPDNYKGAEIDDTLRKLFSHIMYLARYDSSYDTRDRARMFSSLLNSSFNNELGTLVLQAPKPSPVISLTEKLKGSDANLLLGSSSLIIGHPLDAYQSLPPWTDSPEVDPSVRDEQESASAPAPARAISSKDSRGIAWDDNSRHGVAAPRKLKQQTLDEFFSDVNPKGEEVSDSSEEDAEDDEESEEDDNSEEDDEEDDEEDESSEEEEESSEDDEEEGEQSKLL